MNNMKVLNFSYDGLFGRQTGGFASYTASFVKWTNDPGVALVNCSDNKQRMVPTFVLVGFKEKDYPKQELPKSVIKKRDRCGFVFGIPCRS